MGLLGFVGDSDTDGDSDHGLAGSQDEDGAATGGDAGGGAVAARRHQVSSFL